MPEERDIEKQLRAAAEQRRQEAGAPFEMHPATRRMLHGEIRRIHGPKTTALDGKNPIFARLWLRFAAGFCTATVLLISTWVLFIRQPAPKSQQLAKNEVQRTDIIAKRVAPKAAPSPAAAATMPAESARVVADFSQKAGSAAKSDETIAAIPPAAPVVAVGGLAASATAPVDEMPKLSGQIVAQNIRFLNQAATATSGGRQTSALAPLLAAKAADNVAVKQNEPSPEVLNSFHVEQRGEEVRIIDGDGSVYTGQLLAQAEPAKETKLQYADADRARLAPVRREIVTNGMINGAAQIWQSFQNVQFRASGTNRSLQQKVVINAQFLNGNIVGHATLADGRDVPLDAAPTNP